MSIRHGLLALLASGPRHGYQLKTEFEQRTGGGWPLNVGQVYTTLERLERDGLVTGDEPDDDGRRAYAMTDAGRTELNEWLAAATAADQPARDERTTKVLLALVVDDVDPLDVLSRERTALLSALQTHRRRQRSASNADDLPAALAFDAFALRVEAELRWLDVCEERLRQSARNGRKG